MHEIMEIAAMLTNTPADYERRKEDEIFRDGYEQGREDGVPMRLAMFIVGGCSGVLLALAVVGAYRWWPS